MKRIIYIVTGLFLFVASFPAVHAKDTQAATSEKSRLEQQITKQIKTDVLENMKTCDAKWLSRLSVKAPWSKRVVRDMQDPRVLSFMGIPLRLSRTALTNGWDDENVGWKNSYSSSPLEAECERSEFSFDIKMYDKTASVNDVASGFTETLTGERGRISTFDNRNPKDIMVSIKTPIPGDTVGIEVMRVFETSSNKIMVVLLHWHGLRTNETALLSSFFETLKKTPQRVFESNFIRSQCTFGEESYCM